MLINFVNFLLQKIAAINIFKVFLVKMPYFVAVSEWQCATIFACAAIREKIFYYILVGHKGIIINNVGGLK